MCAGYIIARTFLFQVEAFGGAVLVVLPSLLLASLAPRLSAGYTLVRSRVHCRVDYTWYPACHINSQDVLHLTSLTMCVLMWVKKRYQLINTILETGPSDEHTESRRVLKGSQ